MGDDAARAAAAAQRRRARDQPPAPARDDPRAPPAARHRATSSCGRSCRTPRDYVGTLGEAARRLLLRRRVVDVLVPRPRRRPSPPSARCSSKVDAVFAINHALADAKRARATPPRSSSPHGVDHALFARALDDATAGPGRPRRACPGPRIGFYGTLRDWVDFELIAHVARARPAWSIALIGQQLGDVAAIRGLPERPPARPEAATTSCPRTARASTSASSRTASTSG